MPKINVNPLGIQSVSSSVRASAQGVSGAGSGVAGAMSQISPDMPGSVTAGIAEEAAHAIQGAIESLVQAANSIAASLDRASHNYTAADHGSGVKTGKH